MFNLIIAAAETLETPQKGLVSLYQGRPVEEAYLYNVDSIFNRAVGNRRIIRIPVDRKPPDGVSTYSSLSEREPSSYDEADGRKFIENLAEVIQRSPGIYLVHYY